MRSEILDIRHRELLFPRLKALHTQLSEYTFANLYLFRHTHDYEVIFDEEIFIKGKSYDGRTYLMPTGDITTLDIRYIKQLLQQAEFLFPIPQEWLTPFNPEEFDILFKEGDKDYVYTVEKMSTYKGRNLHKKRNLLKQFQKSYPHDARPLSIDLLADARFILNQWLSTSKMRQEDTDYAPCLEALDRYEELILCGGIYYANDEPAGFVLGEELGSNTFVLHFAKARTKFKGVYQYMFNNFASILPAQYKFLNLEQDMEKENLRVFKSSYVPDVMLKKARVSLKKDIFGR